MDITQNINYFVTYWVARGLGAPRAVSLTGNQRLCCRVSQVTRQRGHRVNRRRLISVRPVSGIRQT